MKTLLKPFLFLYSIIGSMLFLITLIALTIVYSFICLLCYKLPYKIRYCVITLWLWLIVSLLTILCGIRYHVEGRENIPEKNAIILSNHQSTWETFVLPRIFPHPAIILKKELLSIPFFGWGLRLLDPISINRKDKSSAMEQVLKQGRKRLNRGDWILIFPQGSRVPVGRVAKYKMGGAILAAKTGFPVVPVALNSGLHWPRGRWLKKPGKITVCIGPTIQTEGRAAKDIMAEAKAWIEEKQTEITPQCKKSKKATPDTDSWV